MTKTTGDKRYLLYRGLLRLSKVSLPGQPWRGQLHRLAIRAGYQAMASDKQAESEALEWAEATLSGTVF